MINGLVANPRYLKRVSYTLSKVFLVVVRIP